MCSLKNITLYGNENAEYVVNINRVLENVKVPWPLTHFLRCCVVQRNNILNVIRWNRWWYSCFIWCYRTRKAANILYNVVVWNINYYCHSTRVNYKFQPLFNTLWNIHPDFLFCGKQGPHGERATNCYHICCYLRAF